MSCTASPSPSPAGLSRRSSRVHLPSAKSADWISEAHLIAEKQTHHTTSPEIRTSAVSVQANGNAAMSPPLPFLTPAPASHRVSTQPAMQRASSFVKPMSRNTSMTDFQGGTKPSSAVPVLAAAPVAAPKPQVYASPVMQAAFEMKVPTERGDVAVLVGASRALGEWDPAKGLRMSTTEQTYPVWHARVSLPCDARSFEYKVVVLRARHGMRPEWEVLSTSSNRVMSLISGSEARVRAEWGVAGAEEMWGAGAATMPVTPKQPRRAAVVPDTPVVPLTPPTDYYCHEERLVAPPIASRHQAEQPPPHRPAPCVPAATAASYPRAAAPVAAALVPVPDVSDMSVAEAEAEAAKAAEEAERAAAAAVEAEERLAKVRAAAAERARLLALYGGASGAAVVVELADLRQGQKAMAARIEHMASTMDMLVGAFLPGKQPLASAPAHTAYHQQVSEAPRPAGAPPPPPAPKPQAVQAPAPPHLAACVVPPALAPPPAMPMCGRLVSVGAYSHSSTDLAAQLSKECAGLAGGGSLSRNGSSAQLAGHIANQAGSIALPPAPAAACPPPPPASPAPPPSPSPAAAAAPVPPPMATAHSPQKMAAPHFISAPKPSASFSLPNSAGHPPPSTGHHAAFDPSRARALLAGCCSAPPMPPMPPPYTPSGAVTVRVGGVLDPIGSMDMSWPPRCVACLATCHNPCPLPHSCTLSRTRAPCLAPALFLAPMPSPSCARATPPRPLLSAPPPPMPVHA